MSMKILHIVRSLTLILCIISFLWYSLISFGESGRKNFIGGDANVWFILDISKSMLVRDIEGRSRLDVAKIRMLELIRENPWLQFSLNIFAGESLRVLPFTNDIWVFQTFLAGISNDNLSVQWTELGLALSDALLNFQADQTGTLIIFTDGDEDDISLEEEIYKALEDQWVDIVIVGVGSIEGWPIIEWVTPFWEIIYKDYEGERVMVSLNVSGLKSLAKDIGGKYVPYNEDIPINFWWTGTRDDDPWKIFLLYFSLFSWMSFLGATIYPMYKL